MPNQQTELALNGSGLPDIYPHEPGYVRASKTSKEAADHIAPTVGGLRDMCLRSLLVYGDLTPDQIAGMLGLSVLSIRPRLTELKKLGLVVKVDGVTRVNSSGRNAAVLRAVAIGE